MAPNYCVNLPISQSLARKFELFSKFLDKMALLSMEFSGNKDFIREYLIENRNVMFAKKFGGLAVKPVSGICVNLEILNYSDVT